MEPEMADFYSHGHLIVSEYKFLQSIPPTVSQRERKKD